MRNIIIFTAFIAISALFSCEKNDKAPVVATTVQPLPYFPAFPGSYWIYDNGDTMKVDGYFDYTFNSASYTAEPVYKTFKLPKLVLNGIFNDNDTYAYVNEYSISKANESNYKDPAFKELLSLTENTEFTIGGASQGHRITGKTVKTDTTITVANVQYNDVIVTIQYDEACITYGNGTPESCADIREYYSKNVGLIKREKRDNISDVFVDDINLVEYYVAP